MTQLVEYGRQALQNRAYERAASLYREAVRRAPMRQDLKDYLGIAIEGALMENPAPRRPAPPARPQPQAPPPRRATPTDRESRGDAQGMGHPQPPHLRPDARPQSRPEPRPEFRFDPPAEPRFGGRLEPRPDPYPPAPRPQPRPEPRYEDEAVPPPRPRPLRNHAVDPRDVETVNEETAAPRPMRPQPERPAPEPRMHGTFPTGSKPHPRPIDFNRRHQRGPLSAYLFGAFVGMLVFGLIGSVGWLYIKYPDVVGRFDKEGASLAELNATIERVKIYTDKGEFSRAIDILKGQPESPQRNEKLADMFSDQGDDLLFRRKPPNYEAAIEAYKHAIQYDPRNAQFRINLADAYYELALSQSDDRKASENFLDLAQQHCDTVLGQDGKNLKALAILSRVAVKKRDDPLLARTLNQIIQAAPDSEDAAKARQDLNELKLTVTAPAGRETKP